MPIDYDKHYFIAELRCLIIQARSPMMLRIGGEQIESALWRCISEIGGMDRLKQERKEFERLYACSTSIGATRAKQNRNPGLA